jgi:hypothetical protein
MTTLRAAPAGSGDSPAQTARELAAQIQELAGALLNLDAASCAADDIAGLRGASNTIGEAISALQSRTEQLGVARQWLSASDPLAGLIQHAAIADRNAIAQRIAEQPVAELSCVARAPQCRAKRIRG